MFLNKDGSGGMSITLPDCNVDAFLMDSENTANYMMKIDNDIYIFRPSQATGMLVYRQLWYSYCNTYYRDNNNGKLLASFYQATNDVSPELILYELPSGKIHKHFPLVRCSKDSDICDKFRSNWPEMMRQRPQWSPNGRYLAFVAVLDAASSDLFVYDTQTGGLRRLTNGPDWVGPIEWSPDGTRIIMQELLNDFEFFFSPYAKPPSSVWSVAVNTNEIKLLYSTGDAYVQQNILGWLDNKRFITYQGFLIDADQATNLRLVDVDTSENKILFDGQFVAASFDPVHEVVALYELNTEKYPQGIYIVSMKDGTIRRLEEPPYTLSFPSWDKNTGLFVSIDSCGNDTQTLLAFNFQGTYKCIPKPISTPEPLETTSYPAPNGKWSLLVNDGLWLEIESQPKVLVSQETISDVIWCPDSSCFFFSVPQENHTWTLYHTSLPDLTIKMVDEGIETSGTYQWLGVK